MRRRVLAGLAAVLLVAGLVPSLALADPAGTTETGSEGADGPGSGSDWARTATIYQVFPDRFRDGDPDNNLDVDPTSSMDDALTDWMGGDLAGVVEGLDHIQDLGFNTIWLGPVNETAYSHGYHPIDHTDVDPNFGDLDALRGLVAAAQSRGMRIVYDLVPNHTSDQHPWFQDVLEHCEDSIYFDWYDFQVCDAEAEEYEYRTFYGIAELPELDLDHPEARSYMLDVVVPFYLDDGFTHPVSGEAGIGFDGFRIDHAKGPSLDFWADFDAAVTAADPDAFTFGEVWDGRDVIADYQGVFDGAVNFPLHDTMKASIAAGGSLASIDATVRADLATYDDGFVLTSFLDNHDLSRFVWEAGQNDGDEAGAIERLRVALTTQFALPGAPIVYQGTEVGMGQSDSGPHPDIGGWEDRFYREPMPWPDLGGDAWQHDWWDDPDNRQTWHDDVAAHVTDLNLARSATTALTHGAYTTVRATTNLLAFERVDGDERVLAVVHTGDEPRDAGLAELYGAAIPDDVTVTDLVDGTIYASGDGDLIVPLEATDAALLAVDGPLPDAPGHQGPVDGPSAVTIAGSFQGDLGCPGDWDPGCPATELTWSDVDQAWEATFSLPAGTHEYKAVTERSWDAGTDFPGQNITLHLDAPADVTFLVDHATEYVLDTVNHEVVVAAGDFQASLGCAGDWDPTCLRSWLQDAERDGVYRRTLRGLTAGDYEFKAVIDRDWSESYPSTNLGFTIPSDGTPVTVIFDRATNDVTVDVGGVPDEDQPDRVVLAGTFQTALGCDGNWDPGCDASALTYDPVGRHWEAGFDLPAGSYEYKAVAHVDGGHEWHGDGSFGLPDGNIPLELASDRIVTFLYGHDTRHIMDNVNRRVVTAPGNYQSEIGCERIQAGLANGDWEPACMRSWLQDLDGDGVYERTVELPAAGYEFKAAINRSWAENYGADGAPDGPNVHFTVAEDGDPVTFRFDSATNVPTVDAAEAEPDLRLDQQRAHWLARKVVAWPLPYEDGSSAELHVAADGGMSVDAETGTVTGADEVLPLTRDEGGLDPDLIDEGWRHLGDATALRLADEVTRDEVAGYVRGQLAVVVRDDSGQLVAATGVQIPGVLDDLYAEVARDAQLGATWDDGAPTLGLWAPTARQVTLHRFRASQPDDPDTPLGDAIAPHPMTFDEASGVWEVTGDPGWDRAYYLYEVEVYVPATGQFETNIVTDPYSHSLSMDSTRSQLVDLTDAELAPEGWGSVTKPAFDGFPTIYELHVRDFSSADPSVPDEHVGTYAAFTHDDTYGIGHLRQLAEAGLTHLHLLPTNDIATIPEDPADRLDPDMPDRDTIRATGPASEEPQQIQQATRDLDPFNWGYDPLHFTVPEGSYSTDPDSPARIVEFREMVAALNELGLGMVKDVVYNHTHAAGQHPNSVFDRIVPGYYHRLDERGAVETSTCCPNTAAEHAMMEKLIVDSVVDWARHYKVDGFRFDLMGHHPRSTMLAVREALDQLTLEDDGIDGTQVLLYGEGWNFGEVVDDRQFTQATQHNMAGTEIGTFNDRLRDAVRGGHPFGGLQEQGFATGLGTDPAAGDGRDLAEQAEAARLANLRIMLGLAGNLATFPIEQPDGEVVAGEQHGAYGASPLDNVVYVSKHDNETLFDVIQLKAPAELPIDERVRMQNLALSTVALAQGIPFFHAGSDLLRSKSLDRNSYNSGDWFNRLDWTGQDNNFGVGLPPEAYNGPSWDVHAEVLENRPWPGPDHIAGNAAHLRELLEIRNSSDAFRLRTAAEIEDRLRFHATGEDAEPGLIVMELAGGDDPDLLIVFNAAPDDVEVATDGTEAESWSLHPVQRGSADARVREAAFDAGTGAVVVPGRTTAVFIADDGLAPGDPVAADLHVAPPRPFTGQQILVSARVVDVDGEPVVEAALDLRVTDASGSSETSALLPLPSGRYQVRASVDVPGRATLEVVTADGRVIGERTVEVRSRPGGSDRWN
jgi:pullulanase